MKSLLVTLLCVISFTTSVLLAAPTAGFFLPDSVKEISFNYRKINNLIVLPVMINDSVQVNLILDTGCRNLVLFGKQFTELFNLDHAKEVNFSGIGRGPGLKGKLAIENKVAFDAVEGKRIPIIIVPNRSIFAPYPKIDGVIGYEVFAKFEVEINFTKQLITFRPGLTADLPAEFNRIPLHLEDSRPIIKTEIEISENEKQAFDLLMDTGSTLGLLVTTGKKYFKRINDENAIGKGLNGLIIGKQIQIKKIRFQDFEMSEVPTSLVYSDTHHYASIGITILQDYVLVLNYCKSYAGLKKNA